ncbi:hypothetical protein BS17DRAFT_811579 [Gyrodon lividus]|nr:hypothetical protein BS17DRAFT_811579 [Gyrodon lividus]
MLSRNNQNLLPRQSGVATVSNTDVTNPTSPTNSPQPTGTSSQNSASANPITAASTSVTPSAAAPDPSTVLDLSTGVSSQPSSSSSVSPALTTVSTDLTTTASPATTSVSQPLITTQQPTSTTPTSSSPSPTSFSPSSSAPRTTSPSPPSTFSPSQTTTSPPKLTSSPGTPTTITSLFTTNINGSQVTTQTAIPTTIPQLPHNTTSSNRTAIIAGSAAGAAVFIILILSVAFCARRNHFKRLRFLDAITSRRKQAHSRAMLLAGEDLEDVGLAQRPPGRYSDYETPWDGSQRSSIARGAASRGSETGSVFREDVWPPPNESSRLIDPLAHSAGIDLRRIVDDVMGPSPGAGHFSQQSISSVHRGEAYGPGGGRGEVGEHSRNWSNGSQVALLEAAGLAGPVSIPSTAPARSSPLAQTGTKPSSEAHNGAGAP